MSIQKHIQTSKTNTETCWKWKKCAANTETMQSQKHTNPENERNRKKKLTERFNRWTNSGDGINLLKNAIKIFFVAKSWWWRENCKNRLHLLFKSIFIHLRQTEWDCGRAKNQFLLSLPSPAFSHCLTFSPHSIISAFPHSFCNDYLYWIY